MFDDFQSRHFPPRLVFTSELEQMAYKSRLIGEARALLAAGDIRESTLLFEQAAHLELELARKGTGGAGRIRSEREISAASCFAKSGNFIEALAIASRHHLEPDTDAFFKQAHSEETSTARLADELKRAFLENAWEKVDSLTQKGIGRLPPRLIWWSRFRVAWRNAHTEAAIDALQRLIVAIPSELNFHLIYLGLGDIDPGAVLQYSQYLVDAFQNDFRSHTARAAAFIRLARFNEAWAAAERALALIPKNDEGINDAGRSNVSLAVAFAAIALRHIGRTDEAIRALDKGLQLRPDDRELRTLRGISLLADGREAEAEQDFARALARPGRSHWAATLGGAVRLQRGDLDGAVDMLQAAIALSDGVMRAKNQNNLGVAFAMRGDMERAAGLFRCALGAEPTLEIAARNLRVLEQSKPELSIEQPLSLADHFEQVSFRSSMERLVEQEYRAAA